MLEAVPGSLISNRFDLYEGTRWVGELDLSAMREKATLTIDDETIRLYREGLASGAFLMECSGGVSAAAEKPSALRSRFEVQLGHDRYTMGKPSAWKQRFDIFDGEVEVGVIRKAAWYSRRAVADLPAEWPLSYRVFVLWLALLMWRREAAAAAGS